MNIVTWNMQGASHSDENKWNTVIKPFFLNGADICCLQECGSMPASAKLVTNNYAGVPGLQYYTWGTARSCYYILFYLSDPVGNRCNLAIVSSAAPAGGCIVYPAYYAWRPALGFLTANNGYVFNVHAISPGGVDAPHLLAAINAVAGYYNWVTAGDYNREPATLAGQFIVCPPNGFTYSVLSPQSKYDYCVKKAGAVTIGRVLDVNMSDHFPVFYNQN